MKKSNLLSLLLFVVVVSQLFYLGSDPASADLFKPPLDKVAHFATFSVITGLLWYSMPRPHWLLVIVIAAAIGALDEFHQMDVPGRIPDWADWAADVFAAITATGLLNFVSLSREQQAPLSESQLSDHCNATVTDI